MKRTIFLIFLTFSFMSVSQAKNKLDLSPPKRPSQQTEKSVDLNQFKGMNLNRDTTSRASFTATCTDEVGTVFDQSAAGYEKCIRESSNDIGSMHKKPGVGIKVGK